MKKIFLLLALPLLFIGCKKNETVVSGDAVPSEAKTASVAACYSYEKDGNVIAVQIETTGQDVVGTMQYALAEKDKNSGVLKGTWDKNILLLDYTFQSEGTESIRQVAFELKDDQLIEGYGEMTDEGTKFKDAAALQFTSTMPLRKTDCPQ